LKNIGDEHRRLDIDVRTGHDTVPDAEALVAVARGDYRSMLHN
jgi:hypothetical protein